MAVHPGGEEVWFVFVDCCGQGSDFGGWSRSESSFLIIRRFDDPGEEDGAKESDDGKDDEGERTDAPNITKSIGGIFDGGMLLIAEIRLSNPGCAIEEEGEPSLEQINEMKSMIRSVYYLSKPRIEPSK